MGPFFNFYKANMGLIYKRKSKFREQFKDFLFQLLLHKYISFANNCNMIYVSSFADGNFEGCHKIMQPTGHTEIILQLLMKERGWSCRLHIVSREMLENCYLFETICRVIPISSKSKYRYDILYSGKFNNFAFMYRSHFLHLPPSNFQITVIWEYSVDMFQFLHSIYILNQEFHTFLSSFGFLFLF